MQRQVRKDFSRLVPAEIGRKLERVDFPCQQKGGSVIDRFVLPVLKLQRLRPQHSRGRIDRIVIGDNTGFPVFIQAIVYQAFQQFYP